MNLTAGPNEEPLSYDEVTLETAADLCIFGRNLALEEACLGNLNFLALLQFCFRPYLQLRAACRLIWPRNDVMSDDQQARLISSVLTSGFFV